MSLPSDLPVIDAPQLNLIFTSLGTMEVTLDPDPLEFGPKRMNGKVAKTRTLLSHCERIFLQVSHSLQLYKRAHRGAQLQFELKTQDLLANDPETRAGRNVRDRDAIATMRLRSEREVINLMEVTIQDLEMTLTVVKAKRADLRDIQVRLAQQQKLCEAEIGLGAKWGSKPAPGTDAPDLLLAPMLDKSAMSQIQDLLDSAAESAEIHLAEGDAAWMVADAVEEQDPEVDAGDFEADPFSGQVDDLLSEVEAIRRGEDMDIAEPYPQVGWCGVEGCGKPVFNTASGTACEDGHGGAQVLDHAPEAKVLAPEVLAPEEPEVAAVPAETEVKAADSTPAPASTDIAMDDLLGDEVSAPAAPMAAVTTDEDVDALFTRMSVEPVAKKKAPPAEEQDIDSLIEMFS